MATTCNGNGQHCHLFRCEAPRPTTRWVLLHIVGPCALVSFQKVPSSFFPIKPLAMKTLGFWVERKGIRNNRSLLCLDDVVSDGWQQ